MAKKQPNPIDVHVGSRVRMRRNMLSMSQENLGDELGLTFQQVQKYEKGTNRIGASRLQQMSAILEVPVAFFFDGAPGRSGDAATKHVERTAEIVSTVELNDFLSSKDGLQLVGAFQKIVSPQLRRRIVNLVEEIAA